MICIPRQTRGTKHRMQEAPSQLPILPLITRPLEEADWPYVAKTATIVTGRDPRSWNTLRARGTKFLLAVSPSHPSIILGFIAFEDFEGPSLSATLLHLAVTKDRYRRNGVFRSLLADAGLTSPTILCSFWNDTMREVAKRVCGLTPIIPT